MAPSSEAGSDLPLHHEKAPASKIPFYKRKKFWIICVIITIILIAIIIPVILLVAFPQIAQATINGSSISLNTVNITFPTQASGSAKRDVDPSSLNANNSYIMSMSGVLGNTGPLGATITFPSPITVSWNGIVLGTLTLPSVSVAGGSGNLVTTTTFIINDTAVMGNFSKFLLSQDQFTWVMEGTVTVSALGRTVDNLKLHKEVTLNGMAGFTKAEVLEFYLPQDDPNGGIDMSIVTSLYNPSPIGVQLGTINLNIGYKNTLIGPVSAKNVFLSSGPNNITLSGKMIKQTAPVDLSNISELMSQYIAGKVSNTTAQGVSAAPDGVHSVGWLSEGFQSITLHVALQTKTPLQLITGISLGSMNFAFNAQSPYSPMVSSDGVSANFKMPFGFSLNITQVEQNMTIATDTDGPIASLQSTWGNATSNSGLGVLNFVIGQSPLTIFPDKYAAFDRFSTNLTLLKSVNFSVVGNATVGASTPIGNVILTGIPFNASTSLVGLQALNSTPTVINSLDVAGGTAEHLNLVIAVGMQNPSNLQITTGDVTFNMIFEDVTLGTVGLPNLTLFRGANSVNAISAFAPASSPQGLKLLTSFIGGNDTTVRIAGFNGTTPITSLAGGLSQISLTSVLPGLKSKLVQNASLVVLSDTLSTSIANAAVVITNPFSAGLTITKVVSTVSYAGMPVGQIDQDISSNPIVVGGKTSSSSPPLNLKMNLQPASIALLLRENALTAPGITSDNIKALDGLLNMGGLNVGNASVTPSADLFKGFNLPLFVETALGNLHVDLVLKSTVKIGQYVTDLDYSQTNIACHTDKSIDLLIPVVGQPIVQAIVNAATLAFDNVVIWNPTSNSFNTWLTGSIKNTGPMEANISFPNGVKVSWNGKTLGQLAMPSVIAYADVGATVNLNATFTVADSGVMAEFSKVLLNEASFDWQIDAEGVAVTALQYTFTGISMSKKVSLKGMQGISAVVDSFQLPGNDPQGGITLIIATTLNNPSNVGISLNVLSFNSFFADNNGDHLLGPLAASSVTIPPSGKISFSMVGRLIPQSSANDLAAIQTVFDNYLAGKNTIVSVVGAGAAGATGDVSWLSEAFKSLKLETSLPGGKDVKLLHGISLTNMAFDFTVPNGAYSPIVSSANGVIANFSLPFGFPINVHDIEETMTIGVNTGAGESSPLALLTLPWGAAKTNPSTLTITTSFTNVPFAVYQPSQSLFDKFTTSLTLAPLAQIPTLQFKGAANVKASSAVGELTLNGINFDLASPIAQTLGGFQDFGGTVTLDNVKVLGSSGQEYIKISLDTKINNPSTISIATGDVHFNVDFQGQSMGLVYLNNLKLVPGLNTVPSEFHLSPGANASPAAQAAAVALLSGYMTGASSQLSINKGVATIPSLAGALGGVQLTTNLVGLQNTPLILSATTVVDLSSINLIGILFGDHSTVPETVDAYVNFVLKNPLDSPFTLATMNANVVVKDFPAKGNSVVLSQFSTNLVTLGEPLTVGPHSQGSLKYAIKVPIVASFSTLLQLIIANHFAFKFQLPVTISLAAQGTGIIVDQFQAALAYSQDNVANTVSLSFGKPNNGEVNSANDAAVAAAIQQYLKNSTASSLIPSLASSASLAAGSSSVLATGSATGVVTTSSTVAPVVQPTSATATPNTPETTPPSTPTTTTPAVVNPDPAPTTSTTSAAPSPTSTSSSNWIDDALGWISNLFPKKP
ncbi:hypothetical protein BC936DRAFT_136643 [Jimgerdemannia flammicorona]|uniref:Uncharacterized protein n=1 Tax=Jimgerdemannia flammicorona TaxID=994334 RepID=A0A433CZ35_9FUNG|nr:hypothetical protein BC936DRAFT_136643 [Jimgerdemannia flammicorona]